MNVPVFVWVIGALLLLRVLLRPILALVYGDAIAAKVAARQPDTIRLVPAGPDAAATPAAIDAWATDLQHAGFSDAGWFTVPEMPGLTLRLLAHEPEGWLCSLYEHRQAGRFVEINRRYPDGTRECWASMRATGLDDLPGTRMTRVPGAGAAALLRAARAGARTDLTPVPVSAANAPRVFETGYAELTAQRKQRGISRGEVFQVALRGPLGKGGGKKAA